MIVTVPSGIAINTDKVCAVQRFGDDLFVSFEHGGLTLKGQDAESVRFLLEERAPRLGEALAMRDAVIVDPADPDHARPVERPSWWSRIWR